MSREPVPHEGGAAQQSRPEDSPAARSGIRHRLFACCQRWADTKHEAYVAAHRRRLLGPLRGSVLEIGPGTGINFKYLSGEVDWHGLEPNLHMHTLVKSEADQFGIPITLTAASVESIPYESNTFDAVIGTLVLCSVDETSTALREILRVLRPGGSYCFIEHVGARPGSGYRLMQRAVTPVWSFFGGGCRPDKDTLSAIRHAAFSGISATVFEVPLPVVRPHISGSAIKG